MSYDQTALWQRALAAQVDDPHEGVRERLRTAYDRFRSRAEPLAAMIAKDLPDFTIHDISHIDALWEYADLVSGVDYPITPCEGFVLGGAFLIHDLGMGLAAFAGDGANIRDLPLWKDTIARLIKNEQARSGQIALREEQNSALEKQATGDVLRALHAEKAEILAKATWQDKNGRNFHLMEDPELRDAFGPIIGKIAHSHWWPVEQLQREFPAILGAPGGFPGEWTVDPIKLAAILRAADFSQLDERRAPAFVQALQGPSGDSINHWIFQEKLYQPRLEGDRLLYTAKSGFNIEEAQAWWVCFDTLHRLDEELRQTDSLLSDLQRKRLAARAVSQAESPARLSKLIKAENWTPIDAKIRVSAIAHLVEMLGGQELYGSRAFPPLRELLQNAGDAIRARRKVEGRSDDWGTIRISSGADENGSWIQVEDCGIGMSESVLSGPLLDFGSTFWGSDLMHKELPGLDASEFEPTGRYGIGFFSIFMWGDCVQVISQRYDEGKSSTSMLEFREGLGKRPLLRKAGHEHYIQDAGTRVKVWFKDQKILKELLNDSSGKVRSLCTAVRELALCSDVTIEVVDENGCVEVAVVANDWLTITDDELRARLPREGYLHHDGRGRPIEVKNSLPVLPLEKIYGDDGRVLGRACLGAPDFGLVPPASLGAVTIGGYRSCLLSGIEGVLLGKPSRASRDEALPLLATTELHAWLKAQTSKVLDQITADDLLHDIAANVRILGGEIKGFPIAKGHKGWMTDSDITKLAESETEIVLVSEGDLDASMYIDGPFEINSNVISSKSYWPGILRARHMRSSWPSFEKDEAWGRHWFHKRCLTGAVIEAVSVAWNCSIQDIFINSEFSSEDLVVEGCLGTQGEKSISRYNVIILRPPEL